MDVEVGQVFSAELGNPLQQEALIWVVSADWQ